MILSSIEQEEFSFYSPLFVDAQNLSGKVFLITGSKGMTGEGLIKSLIYLNSSLHLGLYIFASTRNPDKIPAYIEKEDPISFVPFGKEREFLINKKIDFIVHSASPTDHHYFIEKPVETIRVIIDETERMLDLAKEKNVLSFVYLSSVEAYGAPSQKTILDETYYGAVDQLNVRNSYPLGKKAAEFLCRSYFSEFGVPTKIIRFSSIQGLLQPYSEDKIYNQILRCIIENKNLVMKSDGSTTKSVIYSLDSITALLTVLLKGKNGEAYNATNPALYLSMKDTAETVFKHFAPNLKVVFDIKPTSETGYLPKLCFTQSVDKLTALGWAPHADFDHIYRVDIGRFSK
jgi:UDP-glucuronate decarboxylase